MACPRLKYHELAPVSL